MAAAAAALWFGWASHAPIHESSLRIGLLTLIGLAAASDAFRVNFEFRHQFVFLSFSDTILVVALAFCPAPVMMAGALVGYGAALAIRRHPPVKFCFNLAMRAVEVGLLRLIFSGLSGGGAVLSPRDWWALLCAVGVTYVVNSACLVLVVRLSTTSFRLRSALAPALPQAVLILINLGFGLLGAIVIQAEPWATTLVAMFVAVAALAYRGYAKLSQRYANLRLLYSFSADLAMAQSGDEVIRCVLERSASLLNADVIGLLLPVNAGLMRTSVTASGELVTQLAEPDAIVQAVLTGGQGVVIGRQGKHRLRDAANTAGYRDVAAVPLPLDGAACGVLVVAERASTVSTFDAEDLRLLGALANHASIALRNGQLVDQLTAEASSRAHQALHDSLTGLGNRLLFTERLKAALDAPSDLVVAVMLMDLDEFKEINDTLGHATGDNVLGEVARRLSRAVATRGTVARLGGDEFAIAIPACRDTAEALALARAVQREFDTPVEVDGLTLEVRASIGVTLSPQHGSDPDLLLQRADVAMYSAKAARRGVELYAADRDHYSPRRLSLAADLRHDLEAGRLQVHFQPKADARTARVMGFEALLRWTHPTYGPIPPDEFVPIAEQSGLIAPLTRWVLAEALSHLARWRANGLDVTVAVNLSARSLLDVNLVQDVRRCLRQAGVPGSALVLELTETSVMADPNRSGEVLGELTALGCHVAIDDFGTGYSSLSRLKQLPVDEVKIDKSFVLHMATDADDATIVRSIIDLARNLGLTAVAEGVEDADSWRTLAALGCAQIQGYYFSRPLPAAEIEVWLDRQIVDHLPTFVEKRVATAV